MKKLLLTLAVAAMLPASLMADNVTATLNKTTGETTMNNGIIKMTIGKNGRVSTLRYLPCNNYNILGTNGIYFDYTADANTALNPDKIEIVKQTDDYAEVVYSRTVGDLLIDQGFIMRKDVHGLYTYIVFHGTPTSSSVNLREARVCTRLGATFLHGYVDDVMQGKIPANDEMAVAEQNQIQDATYYLSDGSIYTKYNWAQFIDEDLFHGLMRDNGASRMGVWNIPVSYEWLNGGPMRQELTVHATSKSPITIQMIQGEHLGGAAQKFEDGEAQLIGPFFIYMNKCDTKEEMIADARAQAELQRAEWPYQWFEHELYPLDRATVTGRINITTGQSPEAVKVVLAEPDTELIRQGKNYIYWANADKDGNFEIKNVRKGEYALRAYATQGTVTDELQVKDIAVDADNVDLGTVDWTPATYEHLLWSIGENNRRSDGFKMSDTPRAYGLWNDVPSMNEYVIGASTPTENWYYAQCKTGTWKVTFNLDDEYEGDAHLTASVAGAANNPSVNVKINGVSKGSWSFFNDASIYRSATQAGRHALRTLSFPASLLKKGTNTVELAMNISSKNGGVLWDCLKLEAGNKITEAAGIGSIVADDSDLPYEVFNISGVRVGVFSSLDEADLAAGVYIWRRGLSTGKIVR